MTERDALRAPRDELVRTPRRLWQPTRPQLATFVCLVNSDVACWPVSDKMRDSFNRRVNERKEEPPDQSRFVANMVTQLQLGAEIVLSLVEAISAERTRSRASEAALVCIEARCHLETFSSAPRDTLCDHPYDSVRFIA